jgi:hypothetical protein
LKVFKIMLCLFRTLGKVAEVGAAAADSLVEPVGGGRFADSSNIFMRVSKII